MFKIQVNLIRDHLRKQSLWQETDLGASDLDYSLAPNHASMRDVAAAVAIG